MIVKVTSAAGFLGTARYLEHGRRQGQDVDAGNRVDWVASRNLLEIEDPHLAAEVMEATADTNYRVTQPAYHVRLYFAPEDRPLLDRQRMEAIADELLRRLELDEHQVLIVAHKDTGHPHLHLLVNRVHIEHHRAWNRYQDFRRWEKAARHVERQYGLREVPGHLYQLERGTPSRSPQHGPQQ